jgi:hypothetical protein
VVCTSAKQAAGRELQSATGMRTTASRCQIIRGACVSVRISSRWVTLLLTLVLQSTWQSLYWLAAI